jgi:hypothetical protein
MDPSKSVHSGTEFNLLAVRDSGGVNDDGNSDSLAELRS